MIKEFRPSVSLVGIKHKFGERKIKNQDIENKYNKPNGMLLDKTGKEGGFEWDDGINSALKASLQCLNTLLIDASLTEKDIAAVFGTTNPISVDRKFICESLTQNFVDNVKFMPNVKVSDESFGCGGSAIGVQSMYQWLQVQEINTYAIYITQDSPRGMVEDWNTEALFSDAVSVSLWTNGQSGIMELEKVFSSSSNIADDLLSIDNNGVWRMYGKGVIEDASKVPGIIAKELDIDLADYEIVPHQPNAKLLETLEEMYNVTMYKDVAQKYGNPTCSGAFIALEHFLNNQAQDDKSKRDILVMPFGAGGFGGFILKRRKT